jgi:hypothetical protein
MAAAPAFAAPANPAARLSLTNSDIRAGAPMKHANKAASSTVILAGVALLAVVAGAVALSHSDHKAASA